MLYIDCFSGVSGDMLIGALIDLGADISVIKKTLLDINGVESVSASKINKGGIMASKFTLSYTPDSPRLDDLIGHVDDLKISQDAKELSRNILKTLGVAESKVHNVNLNEVHLHDAVDCIVDAVAVSLALEDLNLINEKICSSEVSCGFIAPATRSIIDDHGIHVRIKSEKEITTPTGVAILANITDKFEDETKFRQHKKKFSGRTGYGAGDMDLSHPNVLKMVM